MLLEGKNMFKYFVSLGWFCGVASSMARYGFRSMSGPFDWANSDLEAVIKLIDTGFTEFLRKENLNVWEEKGQKIILDKRYGINYPHEITNNLEEDYEYIKQKYERRIKHFQEMIKEDTCFIHAVKNEEELLFIQQHYDYILKVLKKSNVKNMIVFLVPQYFDIHFSSNIIYYILYIDKYLCETKDELISLFDTNMEFITFCQENMNEIDRKNNIKFGLESFES